MSYFKRTASFLLVVFTLIIFFQPALAANEDSVLTSIGHSETNTAALSDSVRYVTLTVPFDYAGSTVDLVNGLDITYNDTLYKSVVAVPASPGIAVIDNAGYIAVTVSFNNIDDADGTGKSATTYYVRVERAEKTKAAFSGVIDMDVESGDTITLDSSVFKANYKQNDGQSLGSIVVRGSNLVAGTLGYSAGDTFDNEIGTDNSGEFIGDLTFTASSVGEVSYYIDAYEKGTGDYVGTAVLTISVYACPNASTFSASAYAGTSLGYSAMDFPDFYDLNGGSLESLEITFTDTDYGTWYLGSDALSDAKPNIIDAGKVSQLSFKAAAAGTAKFSWRVANAAGYSQSAAGTITVSSTTLTLSSYSASSKVTKGNTWTVLPSHFSYSPSAASITYIKISSIPASADGYLCLTAALAKNTDCGYPAITANAKLSTGAIIPYNYIQYLRLVTASGSTSASVSFTWTATADGTASSAEWAGSASYTVRFVTGGKIYYDADMNIPLTLDASDFSSEFKDATGYTLSYVTFTLPAKTCGTLYYNYSLSTKTGTAVTTTAKYYTGSSPNLSYVTFVPASNYTGTATISYKAFTSSGTYVSGSLYITVSNSSGGTFSYTIDKNQNLQLDAADFADAFLNATGESLSYVKFTLPYSSCGKLYYDYISSSDYDSTVSSYKKYCVYASPYLSYVTFVPRDDYTGAITINFKGYTSDNVGYSGKFVIFAVDSPAGIVSYTTKLNGATQLSGDDFADEFISVTGSVLSYIVFTPPASTSGALYYSYSSETSTGTKVSASTKYYNGSSPDISDITFVPAENYIGTVEVKYTVYSAGKAAYIGKLKFAVGQASSGSISYKTDYNTALKFKAGDFVSKFYSNTGGSALSYIELSLPSATYGKLYYNYTSSSVFDAAVSAGKKYYVNASPYISGITFVPKSGYSGSFSIVYTGYDANGMGYAGRITITVGGDADTVYYETTSLGEVTFGASDFRDAFKDQTGETLSYVKFTLPSSSCGKLYYGYSSDGSYDTRVTSSAKYYVSAYPYLSRVAFVPDSGYTGTLTIEYTAYNSDGDSSEFALIIAVSDSDGGRVGYKTDKNTPVTLDANDFIEAFEDETGYTLNYVKFTLPSSACGQLYYGYTSSSNYTSKVSVSAKYYKSASPQLSKVTFVPNTGYVGTVTIPYTCCTSDGTAYTGELSIAVSDPDADPFTDVSTNYYWAEEAVIYLYNQGVVTGTGNGKFNPGDPVSRGDFMLMICRAFDLSVSSSDNFTDVSPDAYYYDAVASARALGIAQGSRGMFYPASDLSRQDAMVLIVRTLEALGEPLTKGSAGDLAGYADIGSISGYAAEPAATLVNAGIITGSDGLLNPKNTMSRAEMAVILYRVLTM
ncbi:MAG: S-layer homology domain-containing protein [Oscillospiraceae bacterium]